MNSEIEQSLVHASSCHHEQSRAPGEKSRYWRAPRSFLVALLIAPLLGSPCADPFSGEFSLSLLALFLGDLGVEESPSALKSTTAWETSGPYGGPVRYGLAIDPNTPTTIYAASSGGVFRTTDGGATWSLSSKGITEMFEIKSVAVDPTNPSIVYAGNSDSQYALFRSNDGGATWTSRSTNLAAGTANAIAIDPSNPSTIYLGSPTAVWKTTDAGVTWINLNNGIGQREVVRLAIDRSSPSTIYALTTLAGV